MGVITTKMVVKTTKVGATFLGALKLLSDPDADDPRYAADTDIPEGRNSLSGKDLWCASISVFLPVNL